MAGKSSTPIITRGRKASLKEYNVLTIDDNSSLLMKSEERLKAFFRDEIAGLTKRLTKLEDSLSSVQTECAHLNDDVSKLKEVITNQQLQIESHERRTRANNLILNNIPEDDLSRGTESIADDSEKLDVILKT